MINYIRILGAIVALFFSFSCYAAKFLVVTDIHFDPFLSCQGDNQSLCINTLANENYTAWDATFKQYGIKKSSQYFQNSNYVLLQSLLNKLRHMPTPQFVLLLGDFLGHNFREDYFKYVANADQESYREFVKNTMSFLHFKLQQALFKVPLYFVVGNGDSYHDDYEVRAGGKFYSDMTFLWQDVIRDKNNTFAETFPYEGYYSVTPPHAKGLRLVVLNSSLFSSNQKGATKADIESELYWLQRELNLAKYYHQKVWLAFHIPFALDVHGTLSYQNDILLWKAKFSRQFMDLLHQYPNLVQGIFVGHLHMDSFRLVNYDKTMIMVNPAVTPLFGNNPAFKVYTYDADKFRLQDSVTYYLPPKSKWQKEYDFDKAYKQNNDLRQAMKKVLQKLEHNSSVVKDKFINYFAVDDSESQPITKPQNWPFYLCAMSNFNARDYDLCRAHYSI